MFSIRKALGLAGVVGLMAVTAAPALAAKTAATAPTASRSVAVATFTNQPGAQSFGSVICPAGATATGGGVFGSSGLQQSVNSSYPFGTAGWAAYMNNTSGSIVASFTVYAVCA
jgi:hypothetical protein